LENESVSTDVDVVWVGICDGAGDCAVKGARDVLAASEGKAKDEATVDMFEFICPLPESPIADAKRVENGCKDIPLWLGPFCWAMPFC